MAQPGEYPGMFSSDFFFSRNRHRMQKKQQKNIKVNTNSVTTKAMVTLGDIIPLSSYYASAGYSEVDAFYYVLGAGVAG
jgi:hypothetical protein